MGKGCFFTASASTGLSELFMAVDLQRWFGNQSWFLQERRGRGRGWTDYKGGICRERFLINSSFLCFTKKCIYLITRLSTYKQPANQNLWMFQSKQTDTNMLLTNDD